MKRYYTFLGFGLTKPMNAEFFIVRSFYTENLFQIKYNCDQLCVYFRTLALDTCLDTTVDDSRTPFCLNTEQTYICNH
jgi:hypothetical protein